MYGGLSYEPLENAPLLLALIRIAIAPAAVVSPFSSVAQYSSPSGAQRSDHQLDRLLPGVPLISRSLRIGT